METNWVETDVLLSPQRARARGDDGGANDALRTVSKKRPRSVDGAHSTDAKRTHVVTPDDRFVPSIGVDVERACRESRARATLAPEPRRDDGATRFEALRSGAAHFSVERDDREKRASALSALLSPQKARVFAAPAGSRATEPAFGAGRDLGRSPSPCGGSATWATTSRPFPGRRGHVAVARAAAAALMVFDFETGAPVRDLGWVHDGRCGVLAWNPETRTLTTGSRDSCIWDLDLRCPGFPKTALRSKHTQEVCGLAWSPDGRTLASGGNENLLCLWDARCSRPEPRVASKAHAAAVKAIAWSPDKRSLLATGGGTLDQTVKLWNASSGAVLESKATGTQVTGLAWSKDTGQLLSSHGFSQNQLCVWRWDAAKRSLDKLIEMRKHTARVLALAQSPDFSRVASVGSDEVLMIWSVFDARADAGRGALVGKHRDVRRWDRIRRRRG
ncbi:hypothetical protein JL720_2822 [Aureococcus anophagefferens]|nr:hypothetical protein JL720_2822 [Aureococcus anophagefferens]